MKRKSTSTDEPLHTVRAKINSNIFNALVILDKKFNRSNTDVIRTALYDYLVKNYPGLIPKSDYELYMKAKEKVAIEEFESKYKEFLHSRKWIPEYGQEQKELLSQVDTVQRKINTINRKLRQGGLTQKESQKLKENKEQLLEEYESHLSDLNRVMINLSKLKKKKSNYIEQ